MGVQESINKLNNLNHDNNDWGTILDQVITVCQEMATDHETTKVAVDEGKVVVDELHDDHATFRTEQIAIGATLADYKTEFDLHTHTQQDGDSAQTSKADTTAEGVANAGTDVTFTDTSGSPPATLTATKATAGPATLSAATVTSLT